MAIDYPAHLPREMNVTLVQRRDGWRIQFVTDSGDIWEQDQKPFSSREEAQKVVDQMVADLRVQYDAAIIKPN